MTALLDGGLATLPTVGSYIGGDGGTVPAAMFGADGRNISRATRTLESRDYRQRLLGLSRVYRGMLDGSDRAKLAFKEAMSRSDFSYLFGDIIDRQLLAAYQTRAPQWPAYAKRGRVRDFRTVKRYTLDGGEAVLNKVKELAPYKLRAVTDGKYEYAVEKYGDQIAVSWEALVNDDLDALADLPSRLGTAARRTEEKFAVTLFSSSSGPDSTFFSTAHKNIINSTVVGSTVTANPPLSLPALQLALQVLMQQTDTDGAPIYIEGVTLVVPPALMVVAENILNATQIMAASGGGDGTGNDQLLTNNWMRNRLSLVVNPWLPIVNTTSGNTAWYLFANPSVGRPAMEIGFLMGHETPELWVRSPNAMRVGGGAVAPEEGDFDHDAVQYRVRSVIGGTLMEYRSALASSGAGS